jgi:hypothetical protein
VEGAKHLSAAIKGHKTLTVLDISSNEIGAYSRDNDGRATWIASPEGPVAVADAIRDMGALSVLNLADNKLGELVLPAGWTEGYKADYFAMEYTHTDGRKQDLYPGGKPEGIIALAAVIPGMGAMTSLNLASNYLCGIDEDGRGVYDASGTACSVSCLVSRQLILA